MPRKQFSIDGASNDGHLIAGGITESPVERIVKRPHVSATSGDSVALWDARSGRLLFAKPLQGRRGDVVLDLPTRTLAAEYHTDTSCGVALFDIGTGQRRGIVTPGSEIYMGLSPCFTADGRLLTHTKTQLEWWEPRTGKLLNKRTAPQSGDGFLLSTRACGRFLIAEHANTDPNGGIHSNETRFGLEVLSEKDGKLKGTLLQNHPRLLRYAPHPETEIVALLLAEGDYYRAQVYQAATQKLLATRTFPDTANDDLDFSRDGTLLYVGSFPSRAWQWRSNMVRYTRPREVREFATFFLGEREIYGQYWDGAIRDAQTNHLVVRLRSG